MIFNKQQSPTLASRLAAVDEEIAAGNAAIAKLRSRRRDAIIEGDDVARSVIEDEIANGEREQTLRTERREILAAEHDAALERDARAEFARRYATQQAANEKVAASAQKALRRAWDILVPMMRDLAQAREDTNLLNAAAPSGSAHLPHADDLARGSLALPRVEISSKKVDQWAFKSTGNRVGDQDAVQGGFIPTGPHELQSNPCVKRRFQHVRFHPREDAKYADPISNELRFPRWDGAGAIFEGSTVIPDGVAAALSAIEASQSRKASRPILEEFIPLDDDASDAA